MAEPVTELRAVAGRLRSLLDNTVSPDTRAYASLMKAGERQPWTEAARRIWVAAGAKSEWLHHHLAIVHHSAAYDLEVKGSQNAFVHWKAALDLWSRLIHNEWFWDGMHRHLTDVMGVPVTREVVEQVRQHLRQDLLAPHITLAAQYRLTDPDRAAKHVTLITGSGFPDDTVAAARKQLVGEVIAELPEAVTENRHEEAIDTLATWLAVDPSNVDLVRALLWVSRKALEPLWIEWTDQPVYQRIGRQLDRVTELVTPALAARPSMKDRALSAEVARYEYWLGLVNVGRASYQWRTGKGLASHDKVMMLGGDSVLHFQRAIELDPGLITDNYYKDVGDLCLWAARLVSLSTVHRGTDGRPAEWRTVARCLQRAMDIGPPSSEADSLLDKLIAGPEESSDEVRKQLDRLLGAPVEYQPGLAYWVGLAALRLAEDAGETRREEAVAAAHRAVHHLGRTLATEPMIRRHKEFPDVPELVRKARAIIDHRVAEPPEEIDEPAPEPELPADAVIRGLRRAGRLVAQVLEETGRQLRVGVSTGDLDRFAGRLMTSLGVRSSLYGYNDFPGSICTSVNEVICNGLPDQTVLRPGDLVTLSVALTVDGVHAAAARTFPVGTVAEKVDLLIRRTEEAVQRGIRAVRPGRQLNVIGTVIEAFAARFGYGVVRDFHGHGIGTELMTGLIVPSYHDPRATTVFEPGMAFTIQPMLTLGKVDHEVDENGWTVRAVDGLPAAECSHTVLVTESGVDVLTGAR